MTRILASLVLAIFVLQLFGNVALAGPEWCDDGSPPPNDFRFRPTGAPSATSSTSWLKSTTSGTLVLATGVNTLVGGVAHGMATAIEHAGVKEPGAKPDRARDHERPAKPDHDTGR